MKVPHDPSDDPIRVSPGGIPLEPGVIGGDWPRLELPEQPEPLPETVTFWSPKLPPPGEQPLWPDFPILDDTWWEKYLALKQKPVELVMPFDWEKVKPVEPVATGIAPVAAGDFLIWPDPQKQRGHYAPKTPRLTEFFIVALEGADLTISGGRALLTLSVMDSTTDAQELKARRQMLSTKLKASGHQDASDWQYIPLTPSTLSASLTLPQGFMDAAPTVETSPNQGLVNVMLELTADGANSWYSALESSTPGALQGMCKVTMDFAAVEGGRLLTKKHELTAQFGALAESANLGPDSIRKERPPSSPALKPHMIVRGDASIKFVNLELRPSFGRVKATFLRLSRRDSCDRLAS